ncbi:MAG: DUF4276 family protein [Planctomycetes bacterium]|nr:DUF4276 family protein [Planctomycetota bacterium]
MSRLRIAPIVEGHGEVIAIRRLLERIWREVVGGEYLEVLQPVRLPRSKLLTTDIKHGIKTADDQEIERAVKFAAAKLQGRRDVPMSDLVLLLLDADTDCPKDLAPNLLRAVQEAAGAQDATVILANVEYETWFVGAAESLEGPLRLDAGDADIADPEQRRYGKGWIKQRFTGTKYSETVDQVKLTARMDLEACRARCPSFDKLCRELEARSGTTE